MKKLICIVLSLCLALGLSACACVAPPEDTTPTTLPAPVTEPSITPGHSTEPSTEPATEPTVDIGGLELSLPMVSISLTEHTEITNNDKNQAVFEYVYPNIRLQLDDAEIANIITLDLLNRIDATRDAAETIQNGALLNGIGVMAHYYRLRYTPTRIDSGILSLFSTVTTYEGGAHGGVTCRGLTYDLTTGNVLNLSDVLAEGTTADVICRLVVDVLEAKANELYLFDDFSLMVESRFSGDFLADERWYLSGEGLCFTFDPYEIAPNAAGIVTAVIPYHLLTGILLDDYFPAEQIYSDSNLCGIRFDQSTEDEFNRFAELILNPDSETALLYTNGLIYDIVIESGHWNTAGTIFIADSTVFAASSLTPGDAILIQTVIPESMPRLRITYTKGGERICAYLGTGGKDSTSILTD